MSGGPSSSTGEAVGRAGDECKTRDPSESDNLKPMTRSKIIPVIGAILVATASTASAALLAYEPFNYAAGPLAGKNGGFGFTAAWFPQTTYYTPGSTAGANVFASSLTYAGLATTGGSMESRNSYESAGRTLPVGSLTTGTYYMSFLIAKGPNASGQDGNNLGAPDYGGLSFYGGNAGPEVYFFGYGGAPANGEQDIALWPSSTSGATFLVYKLNLNYRPVFRLCQPHGRCGRAHPHSHVDQHGGLGEHRDKQRPRGIDR